MTVEELIKQFEDRAGLYANLGRSDRCAEVSRCALELRAAVGLLTKKEPKPR